MEDETRMNWLSGKPQRVLNLARPSIFASARSDYCAQWSVMDDQIMLTFPSTENVQSPSLIFLADINSSLGTEDDVVNFKQIAELPFHATKSRLLSNRAGFTTAEFKESENTLTLRTHDWTGGINREKSLSVNGLDGEIAVHGSSIALCVRDGPKTQRNCLGSSNQIAIWDTESGNLTRIEVPQDERAPQCHRGNLQFVTPSHIALGGHIDSCYDEPYSVLRSIPITPSELVKGRYFHHSGNFESADNHDAIAIPGSSTHSDFVVHHHHKRGRFTVANLGLLTGEIPSEAEPTPGYFIDPDYHKDLFHVFYKKPNNARTIYGGVFDRLSSLVGNKLLVREDIDEHEHDEDNYCAYNGTYSSPGTFQVLYLYDFDQSRCKALRQLSPDVERQHLEARLKERNPKANVTVTSRRFWAGIEEESDEEEDTSPEWKAHIKNLWETRWARERGEAKFPTLEFDDPLKAHDDGRILFTRSMLCLPKIRDGEQLAMTTSAIIEIPTLNADGYVHYFGAE
ncbi:hypothetical protein V8C35DRAFT_317297 [Trichoderma chlorosporum]